MYANSVSKRRLLVLGGTSSLADAVIDKALALGFTVHATRRNSTNHHVREDIDAWHELDLDESSSVKDFIDSVSMEKFDTVICLLGKVFQTSDLESNRNFEKLTNYFTSQVVRLSVVCQFLIEECMSEYPTSSFIYLSSRSAVNGSWDQYYACAKGAMHSYFLSLANKVEIHSQIILVVSGLIQNSRMYQQMSPENRQKHLTLSGGFLPNTEDFANFVFELNQTWATQSISPVVWFGNPY